MADDTPPLPNQTFIQSREPAQNGYGQNGSPLPSSVPMDRQPAQSKFSPAKSEAHRIIEANGFDDQTRKIDPKPEATTYGTKPSTPNPAQVPAGGRPVTTQAPREPSMKSLTGRHN